MVYIETLTVDVQTVDGIWAVLYSFFILLSWIFIVNLFNVRVILLYKVNIIRIYHMINIIFIVNISSITVIGERGAEQSEEHRTC